ncbi:MAG: hypothetical protein HXM16_05400 [Fusobacterium periodonticum]|nr:hypothetical protein [Fusobacterium periodonticum]
MNKQELAKEIELQEERLTQLKKEYIEESKFNLKVGKCFARWQGIIYIYFKIIEVNINKHRPIKAIKVINNQSIEIIELYLKDYSFILDISTKQFDDIYSETLETISNYYEQG